MFKTKLISAVVVVGALFCFAAVRNISAQGVASYFFTSTSGTFTPLSAGTPLVIQSGDADDGRYVAVPIGFTFNFDGTNYTQVGTCTNGWMSFVPATNFARVNDLDGSAGGPNRPFVAPFFDDHDMQSGSVSYQLTGTAPNRVFTMQWLNTRWDYFAATPGISFQAKLYERTNRVQFVYRQEAGAIGMDPNSFGATIGIAGIATGSGQYLSLNNSGATPTTSSTVVTTNISTKPSTGRIYTFTPTATASNVSVSGRVSTSDGRGLSNALVTMTDTDGAIRTTKTSSFGYYQFDEVTSGRTYVVSIISKRYQFTSQAVSVADAVSDLHFIAQ